MNKYKIGDKVRINDKKVYEKQCLRKGGFFEYEILRLKYANDCFGKETIIVGINHISETHYYDDGCKKFKLKYEEYILDINRGIMWRDSMFEPINKINK